MELQDYLMPDEYIISLVQGKFKPRAEIDEFNNVAVTNKRIILYRESQKRFLRRTPSKPRIESLRSWHFSEIDFIQITHFKDEKPSLIIWLKPAGHIEVYIEDWGVGAKRLDSALSTIAKKVEKSPTINWYRF
ncbi:hypothetical protein [Thermococcus sp.]|uniref:hypothetical protein n=1 Tax=Thermococcus sp. TaxID=35749 RepID=UPI00261E4F7E|nr:hypothetical protein [Thermococcus sp.]